MFSFDTTKNLDACCQFIMASASKCCDTHSTAIVKDVDVLEFGYEFCFIQSLVSIGLEAFPSVFYPNCCLTNNAAKRPDVHIWLYPARLIHYEWICERVWVIAFRSTFISSIIQTITAI